MLNFKEFQAKKSANNKYPIVIIPLIILLYFIQCWKLFSIPFFRLWEVYYSQILQHKYFLDTRINVSLIFILYFVKVWTTKPKILIYLLRLFWCTVSNIYWSTMNLASWKVVLLGDFVVIKVIDVLQSCDLYYIILGTYHQINSIIEHSERLWFL